MNETLSEQHCVCCDSTNIICISNTSFFELPIMKGANGADHFVQFTKDNVEGKKDYSET